MNDGLDRQELIEILRENKLLTVEELVRAEAMEPAADGAALAKALVEAGLLTDFQMEAVVNRRPEKLKIGNYDLIDKLGTGGSGTVYKARHRRMKRVVAIKVLTRNLCKDKAFVQRFQREVETIAQLSHPNIVMAYDADEAKVGHYLVMEFVAGPDLSSVVQKQGPLGIAEAIDATMQTARGLGYVHDQGMIHRDIKPANLLRDATGTVKVTDLGLARFSNSSAVAMMNSLTQAGGVLGTVDYMSPEQALDSTTIDRRSDIYSLGATFYYLLIGQPVFPGQTMMDTLLKHRDAPIPSLTAARPEIPTALDDVFRRMMAKSVADRYQTMGELVRDLEAVQAQLGDTATMSPKTIVAPAKPSDSGRAPALPAKPKDTIITPRAVSDHTMDLPSLSAEVNAGLMVLLVEPSRTQASIIRKYLGSQNITQLSVAATGAEALNAVRNDSPNAVISAMYLPDMSGVQLAQQIREEKPKNGPGFLLISSESDHPESGALTQCGQAMLLEKPFSPEKLVNALSIVTGQMLAVMPTTPEDLGVSLVRPIMLGALPAPTPAARIGKLRVLIVDDSKPARMHVRNVLTGMGVTHMSEAADGAQAVAVLARDSFDLIVTDFNMPLMDGRSLVGYLKQNPATASVKVIMVTTETDQKSLDAIHSLGVAAICEKSFPPEVVRKVIDQLLQAPP